MIFELILLVGVRCVLRFWDALHLLLRQSQHCDERVLLIGAGRSGRMLAREMLTSPSLNVKLCGVIDDNTSQWGKYLESVPIVGGRDDILANVEAFRIEKILFAIPSAAAEDRRDILNICLR